MSATRARAPVTIGFKRLANAAKIKDNKNLIGFVSFALLRTNEIDIKRWINYIIFLCFCQIKNANKKNEQDFGARHEQDLHDLHDFHDLQD